MFGRFSDFLIEKHLIYEKNPQNAKQTAVQNGNENFQKIFRDFSDSLIDLLSKIYKKFKMNIFASFVHNLKQYCFDNLLADLNSDSLP